MQYEKKIYVDVYFSINETLCLLPGVVAVVMENILLDYIAYV